MCWASLLGLLNTALHSGHSFVGSFGTSGDVSLTARVPSSGCNLIVCFDNCDFLVNFLLHNEQDILSGFT